jgi:hypothetical protein
MPQAYITKLAKKHGISISTAERRWNKAKSQAAKEGQDEDYAYVTGIFKKMMKENVLTSIISNLKEKAEVSQADVEKSTIDKKLDHKEIHGHDEMGDESDKKADKKLAKELAADIDKKKGEPYSKKEYAALQRDKKAVDESADVDEFVKSGGEIQKIARGKEPKNSEKFASLGSSHAGKGGSGKNSKMSGLGTKIKKPRKPVDESIKMSFKDFLFNETVGKKEMNLYTADTGDFDAHHPEKFHTIEHFKTKEEAQTALDKHPTKKAMSGVYTIKGPETWLKKGAK